MKRHGTERPHKLRLSSRLMAILHEKYLDAMQDAFLSKSPYQFDKGEAVGDVIILERVISEEFSVGLFKQHPDGIDAIHQKLYRVFDYSDKSERTISEEAVLMRISKMAKAVIVP